MTDMAKQTKTRTHHELMAIAAEAQVALNTVRRWQSGQEIRGISRVRIESAVDRLASTRGRAGQ